MPQQTQERPPQEERPEPGRSLTWWQRYRKSPRAKKWLYIGLVLLPIVLLIICMSTVFTQPRFNPYAGRYPTPKAVAPTPHQQPGAPAPGKVERTQDLALIAQEVLTDLNVHGYDSRYHTILINWRKSNVNQVNCGPSHCDTRGNLSRTDTANDLRDLENLYWYRQLHPLDHWLDGYIARMEPIVKSEWGNTTLNKGWVYYTLLRIRDYSHDNAYWDKTIQHWAAAQYKKIDPQIGVPHRQLDTTAGGGNTTLADGYRVDHALESSLALVDAGTRYNHPEWITAGKRGVDTVIKQSYSKQFHLFGRIYLISDPRFGTNKLIDTQARMGETGQEMEALLRTGLYTHNNEYLNLAYEMLDGLQKSPLRDRQHGGLFFKIYLGPYQGKTTGYVDKGQKEARQMHVLIAIHIANQIFNNRWSELEQDITNNAVQHLFLPGAVPGFTYRVYPDGRLYKCPKCALPHAEDWVTAEADNISLEALQTIQTKNWLN